jgi:nucleoside 2-deoxyribosyltransferase
MRAYISVSYNKIHSLRNVLNCISTVAETHHIQPFIFCDHYTFTAAEEQLMMQQAMLDIDQCDILIAEVSDKAIGIGVEAGYAKGKNKPVIYLRQKDCEHSTTISGISNYSIIYENINDLEQQLTSGIKKILSDVQRG